MSRKVISGIMLTISLTSMFTVVFGVQPVRATGTIYTNPSAHASLYENGFWNVATQNIDWWLMYRHDPQHTSYSTSKAPNINRTLWIKQFGDWIRSSPTVHNNVVFIGADDGASMGGVYALNGTTGEQIWNYTTGGDVFSSPAVVYDRVYFGSYDRKLYCLDETNGNRLWSFQTGDVIYSSPCVTENKVVFGSNDHKLYCLDATTGNHLWNFSTWEAVYSSPAIAGGKVFFGSCDATVYVLALTNGTLIWSYTTDGSITDSPSVLDGKVFISSSNRIYCLDASDGDLIWSYTAGGTILSSPATAEGNVFIGCNDHKMYCLSAVNGQLKWTFTTGDVIYSSSAVADGKLFFGSNDKKVYCLNATTGKLVWSYNTGGEIKTSCPAVAQRVIFVASNYYPPFSGRLFAFGRLANTPPVTVNLTVTPPSPVTTDNLIGSYDYYDEDGDPENGTEIRWHKNGIPQSEYNDSLKIPSSATTKGETWYFTVRPKDGEDFGGLQTSSLVTIQNSPPSIGNVTITPDPAYKNDTLSANPSWWFDVDSDPEGYFYQWKKYEEAVGWQNITGATGRTLSHENFVKGDLIKILCIPYDGESHGDAKEDTVTISNSPPAIDSYYPLINPTITEGESQNFNITKFDIDSDPLTVTWWKNQSYTEETSDSYTFTADYGSAGIYNVTVVVSDGLSQASHHWELTVTHVERDIAIVNITLSKNIVAEGLTISFDVVITNQGELAETFNVTANANTTIIGTVTDITLTSGNSITITFAWNTTCFAKGNYTVIAEVTSVPGEIDTADNTIVDGWVLVTFPGDVNGDKKVRVDDVLAVALAFGSDYPEPPYDPNLDVNGDLKIRVDDVLTAALNFGQG